MGKERKVERGGEFDQRLSHPPSLLCYPRCRNDTVGVGPVCWMDGRPVNGRGFGKPLGCSKGRQYQLGLCMFGFSMSTTNSGAPLGYERCPKGYSGFGPFCKEDCPVDKPFECGDLCAGNKRECSAEVLDLTRRGFSVLFGLGAIGSSIALTIGTSGAAIGLGAFGVASSSTNAGMVTEINREGFLTHR